MKFARISLLALAVAIVAVACANPDPETINPSQPAMSASPVSTVTTDEFAAARANFAKHCVVCHGDEGRAGLVKIEDVTLKVPSLREGHALRHTDERLVKQITMGDDEMPAFKDKLSPEEINDLVKFIRAEFQKGNATK